jgi:hypothetical protein
MFVYVLCVCAAVYMKKIAGPTAKLYFPQVNGAALDTKLCDPIELIIKIKTSPSLEGKIFPLLLLLVYTAK